MGIFCYYLPHRLGPFNSYDAREIAMSKMIEASQRMITMKTMNIQGEGINPYYKEAFGIRNKDAPKCVYRCG